MFVMRKVNAPLVMMEAVKAELESLIKKLEAVQKLRAEELTVRAQRGPWVARALPVIATRAAAIRENDEFGKSCWRIWFVVQRSETSSDRDYSNL